MGSSLGPTLANLFLCHHEKIWLDNCPIELKPAWYRRYVDDIFTLFRSEESANLFKSYMNGMHANINFTNEKEIDGCLSFLDILITRNEGRYHTNIYRKPTFSGIYSNFKSFIPTTFKLNLLFTLLFRLFHIISGTSSFHVEVEKLKGIMLKNGYPARIFARCVKLFLAKNKTHVKVTTVPKKEVFVILPYLGKTSMKIASSLKKLFGKAFPYIELNIVFRISCRISTLFSYKDRVPDSLLSDFVYYFECCSCKFTHVGITRRHKKVRICEHRGVSPKTGKLRKGQISTSVRDHMLENADCTVNDGDFSIISRGGSKEDLEIKETLLIKKLRPTLNKASKSIQLFLFEDKWQQFYI